MNLTFLKRLIECDLVFAQKPNKFNLVLNNPLVLNKEIKQFIRCYQLLSKSAQVDLYLWVEDKYTFEVLDMFLKSPQSDLNVILTKTLPLIHRTNNSKALISVLDSPFSKPQDYRKLINSRLFFLNSLATNSRKLKLGSYSMSLNLKDLNRLAFFIALMRGLVGKLP